MSAKNIVLNINDWNPEEIKYMAPKVNAMGGKSINIISKQTNRSLHISTPLLMTWGISDFTDEKTGESDGKYSISLQFPNDEYRNDATDAFLAKLLAFENQILEDSVKNSELWWGEKKSLEICRDRFFPFVKYSKNKDTKKIDYSKPPTFRPKVTCYDNKWGLEIYDTNTNLIFPCENDSSGLPKTPMEFVPKLSRVACGIQCTGIWIGGKGFGASFKIFQCIVKPVEIVKVSGTGICQFQLSDDDRSDVKVEPTVEVPPQPQLKPSSVSVSVSTEVDDSDNEETEPVVVETPVVEEEAVVEEVVAEPEPVAEPVVVKKVLKKVVVAPVVVAPVVDVVETETAVEVAVEAPKKKMVLKKKAV